MTGPRRTQRQDRIAKGLCPNCGSEAAPYYLCANCRFGAKLDRTLKRAAKGGVFQKIGSGRKALWDIAPAYKGKGKIDWHQTCGFRADAKDGDRRKAPRLRGIPVDVEAQIVQILKGFGRPVLIEEILAAWGKLREKRNGSISSNVITIIRAKDERSAKNARRAARAGFKQAEVFP